MHCITSLKKYALFIVTPMFLMTACSPTPDNTLSSVDDNGGYASDASRIEWINNDVISIADAAGLVYNGAYMRTTHTTLGTCATVGTDTTSGFTHSLVIRFGISIGGTNSPNDDCTCLDGRKRRGTIIVSYSGRYFDFGQVHTITYDNYYINDNQLTGSVQTMLVDTTVTGNWHYNVVVNDSLNMSPDPLKSQFIVWNGSLDRKWISGFGTPDRGDDAFSISGNATITRPNGHQFTFNISSPFVFAMNCSYAQSGIATILGAQGSRVLNYGTGGCDANAQVSLGGNTVFNFTLTK